jgi:hypothetical protein
MRCGRFRAVIASSRRHGTSVGVGATSRSMADGRSWRTHERLAFARVLGGLDAPGLDRTRLVASALRGLAELLLDGRYWEEAERVRSCARALEQPLIGMR